MTATLTTFLRKHPSLTHSELMQDLCAPLEKLGIVYFSHVIVDNKQHFYGLGSKPEFFKLYFEKGYQDYDLHKANSDNHEKYTLWDLVDRKGMSRKLHEDFTSFNQGHTFSITVNHKDHKECFHFGAKLGNEAINGQYMQNLEAIKHFIRYFKEQVATIKELNQAYRLSLPLSTTVGGYLTSSTDWSSALGQNQPLSRYYIDGKGTYITHREYEVLYWLSLSKTADEIGLILGITERTVKAHIKSIKDKSHCYNQFQLGMLFAKLQALT